MREMVGRRTAICNNLQHLVAAVRTRVRIEQTAFFMIQTRYVQGVEPVASTPQTWNRNRAQLPPWAQVSSHFRAQITLPIFELKFLPLGFLPLCKGAVLLKVLTVQ